MDDRPIRSLFQREPTQKELLRGEEPSEVDLSPEDLEKIRLAREVMIVLVKTAKAYRIYLANNELLQKFQAELFEKLTAYLATYEDLELRIRQASITMLGQPIYRSQDESENLANQLYRDGLRRISLHSGITLEEVLGFLDVLKKNADRTRDEDFDFITLMWEKDFKFITYHAVEELLPEGVEPHEVETEAEAQIEKIATLNFYSDEDMNFDETIFGTTTAEKRQDIFDNEAPSEEVLLKSQLASHFLALETEEIRKIQATIENEKIEDLFIDMADVIMEIIYIERSFDDFKMLAESLEQILAMFFNNLDLKYTNEILDRLHFLADGFRQTSSKAAAVIDEIIARAGSEEKMTIISNALTQGTFTSTEHLGNFLVRLGSSSIPFLCKRVNETNNADMRKNFCDILVLLGRKHFDKIMESMEDRSEASMRNKIYVLTRLGNEKSVPYFRKLIQHPNTSIRQLIISSMSRFYNAVTRDVLVQTLEDRDPAVRMATLRCLGQTRDRKVLEALLPLVRTAGFHEKDMQEKKLLFSTLALIGGNELSESFL